MKKPLDNFTVERLEEIIAEEGYSAMRTPKNDEVRALARIALAAKRAEPVAWKWRGAVGDIWTEKKEKADFVKKFCPELPVIELYATPQLNSPEIPEDWPTEGMVIAGFESGAWNALSSAVLKHQCWPYSCRESAECVTGIFKAMLAAAPESNHD
ncbi:hypothetical protein [Yersinia aleksiciae]|uniref:hypothetical protein n=1 Tax=Yersinia aleksiciae TaxID=263819 RepID=UPI0011AA1932|nr:hypothetical protein [Yersinia aleksiciae]